MQGIYREWRTWIFRCWLFAVISEKDVANTTTDKSIADRAITNEATALELMDVVPPFDRNAKIIASAPQTMDAYMHVQHTAETIARQRAAISIFSERLFTGKV